MDETPPHEPDPRAAWNRFVDGLRAAGDQLAADTDELDPIQRADAFRSLLRAVNNMLGRFEVDRERPELVAFNGWRQKMFMDNPDFRYWVADIHDDRRYRITGAVGDAVFQSVTVYAGTGPLRATSVARVDSDTIAFDEDGRFDLTLSPDRPTDGSDWLELPEGSTALWVRQFHHDARSDRLGWCDVVALDDAAAPPSIDPMGFDADLTRMASGLSMLPMLWDAAVRDDVAEPNAVRRWSEMAGGAAYTEPDISYLRGSWDLEDDEALVVEGTPPPSRYWNVLLYSRFLNSLDHRARSVSRTDGTATLDGGRYRFVISGTDPEAVVPGFVGDWLDTEGRPFGLFVFRFLQPSAEPDLPTVRRCRITDLQER